MKYDFTTIMDRKGKDAIALDVETALKGGMLGVENVKIKEGFSVIPMWVADMNFPTVPTVQEALIQRAKHPAFGYFSPSSEYYYSIIRWQQTRNGVTGLTSECIGYENGVLGGVVSALNVFCSRGDKVLLHSPTYIGFTGSLKNNGYDMVLSPLKRDEKGVWRMILEGHKHIPTQSVSPDARMRTAAFYAPSKTFNLAGLVGSYHIVYNKWIRDRMEKESSLSHYNSMNVLSMHALIGAYKPEGYEWVDQLCQVLTDNVNYAYDYITTHFSGVELSRPEGTYMLFLDCTRWCQEHGKTLDELEAAGIQAGVIWQDGRPFHGPCSIRMNLALPHSLVKEAMDRLDKYVFNA